MGGLSWASPQLAAASVPSVVASVPGPANNPGRAPVRERPLAETRDAPAHGRQRARAVWQLIPLQLPALGRGFFWCLFCIYYCHFWRFFSLL